MTLLCATMTVLPLSFLLLAAAPQLVHGLCQKYVDAATTAAANLQSKYFSDGTYGDQAIWIGAVDNWYLQLRGYF